MTRLNDRSSPLGFKVGLASEKYRGAVAGFGECLVRKVGEKCG